MAQYTEYKNYEVLGYEKIPREWALKKIKYLFSIGRGRVISQEELLDDGLYPVFSSQTQNNGCLGFINTYDFDCDQLTWTTDGANAGTIFLRSGKHNCTNVCGTLQSKQDCVNLKYSYYSLQYATQFHKRPDTNGAKIMNNEMAEISIAEPSSFEQSKIVDFLDHETAKIDSLIEKQQKLIELLKEKRQAVISHAVTKGLNPDVPMKDSGVEWLGQVPEHWKVIKLKHLTTLFEQGWSPQCDSRPAESNEYGVLKVGCVNGGKFRPSENKALPPELEPKLQYLIQRNDLLISRANTKELVGSAAVIDDDYPNLILCDKLYRIRFNQNVCAEMVALYLSIGVVREQIELGASGASHSMQNIGQDTIKELFYLLQPIDEAQNILMNIIESNKQFDSLISKAESAIQLLQERRTALISSVITGKIDVRHWQNPQQDLAV